jgi:DNA-binding NarL/FixJ family response regulator
MSIEQSRRNGRGGHANGSARTAAWHEPWSDHTLPGQRLTTVLYDRNPTWLQAVEQVLVRLDIDVVGKATRPERALALVAERRPDLLIAEIETGDSEMKGISCLRRAKERVPDIRTIVFSVTDDPDDVAAAFRAGASAYVQKRTHPDDFAMAIRQLFTQSIHFADDRVRPRRSLRDQSPLSPREAEILELVAEGRTNAEMAKGLWVTEQTVKFHLRNIYRKLGVSNRTAASRWAHAHGLLSDEGLDDNHNPEPEGEP